jgi:hypothetical protein
VMDRHRLAQPSVELARHAWFVASIESVDGHAVFSPIVTLMKFIPFEVIHVGLSICSRNRSLIGRKDGVRLGDHLFILRNEHVWFRPPQRLSTRWGRAVSFPPLRRIVSMPRAERRRRTHAPASVALRPHVRPVAELSSTGPASTPWGGTEICHDCAQPRCRDALP